MMQGRREDQVQDIRGNLNTTEPFPRVVSQHHFPDGSEGIASGIPFQLPSYSIAQPNVHTSALHGGMTMQVQAHHQTQLHQVTAHSQGQQQAQQFQRLKVEDALSYLDQVKLQFGNQPQVYNDFLDIMKEFKSQAIDTPGVISRVSNLFKGHPDLIVGFNTFLPPGYKIEVNSTDSTISVQQPGQPSIALSQLGQAAHSATAAIVKTPHHTPSGTHPGSHHSYHKPTTETSPLSTPGGGGGGGQSGQPVEFNHAINYVNKIKNRFQGQPEIYKNFLEILHTYQKEQRQLKEGLIPTGYKPLSESEVYSQVAKLFQNQEDLLSEFGQFLPDANGGGGALHLPKNTELYLRDHTSTLKKPSFSNKNQSNKGAPHARRPSNGAVPPLAKKAKTVMLKDVSLAEAAKHGTLAEYAFFDKVRRSLKSQEVYDNFLRCLVLFNQEVIARSELVQLIQPFLAKFPELFRYFKDFLGYKEQGGMVEALPGGMLKKERISNDLAMEIDYNSCKRYGASYRALPKSYSPPKCSGRTPLCKEVLNDTWVSFPTWSEDSTFVTSRKTQFEENIYRCEDERFELDVVIEANTATIRVLEAVQKKMARMTSDEAAKFRLDNALGGTSEVIHRKAIQRIYGDKAADIIDGLKKNPVVAVPLVLRRLKAKDDEWHDAQKQFNKIWREQNEKYYLKSLDHQSINFKPNDAKALRSKALISEIETIYNEHQQSKEDTGADTTSKPHVTLTYKDRSVLNDALGLIIHHLKRQASIHKEEKQKIKVLLRHHIQDMFHLSRQELSDDEDERDDGDEADDGVDPKQRKNFKHSEKAAAKPATSNDAFTAEKDLCDDDYVLFFTNNYWYLFFRLHNILCDRLARIHNVAQELAQEDALCKKEKSQTTAVALRLRAASEVAPAEAYTYFLDMVKSLLDGNIEPSNYEDMLRDHFGIHAYITFTLDKVVQNIVRQLQHIVTDELSQDVTEIFLRERENLATGGPLSTRHLRINQEAAYEKRVEQLLTDENCFKIQTYKKDGHVTLNLLDTDADNSENGVEAKRWSQYTERFVTCNDDSLSEELKDHLTKKPIFLQRNARQWRNYNRALQRKNESQEEEEKESVDDGNGKERGSEDSGGGIRDEDDTQDSSITTAGTKRTAATDRLKVLDKEEGRFHLSTLKMLHVVNSESFLYRCRALTRTRECHKSVSLTMYKRFSSFWQEWLRKNVSEEHLGRCDQWLMGEAGGCRECFTTKVTRTDFEESAPYHKYYKYKVVYTNAEYGSDIADEKEVESMDLS